MEELFSLNGIMALISIIVIIIFIIIGRYSKKEYPQTPLPIKASEEAVPIEDSESFLIHCPACGTEISRHAPACLKCGHPICPTKPTHHETIINVLPEKKKDRGGCLWSLLGLIVLIVASIFFNFIGYFIALIILALCRVFSAGEAIFLFIIGIILIVLLPILGIISIGALLLS